MRSGFSRSMLYTDVFVSICMIGKKCVNKCVSLFFKIFLRDGFSRM